MQHYFWGEDTYAARQAIGQLAEEQQAAIHWLDEADLIERPLATRLGERGLFGRELLVVRDPAGMAPAVQEAIATALTQSGAGLGVAWDRGTPDQRSLLPKRLRSHGQCFSFLDGPHLTDWLIAQAAAYEVAVEPEAARLLVERLGPDRWRLESELQRLLLGVQGKRLSRDVVAREVPITETADIFPTLEAIVAGKRAQACSAVEHLLAAGHGELYIVSMLAYQFRTLCLVRAGVDQKLAPPVVARRAGLHPYVVQKSWAAARRLPAVRLQRALTSVLATDFAMKRGAVDMRTGLFMLVLQLSRTVG